MQDRHLFSAAPLLLLAVCATCRANGPGSAAGKKLIRVAREGRLVCSALADIEDPAEQAQFLQDHVASWQGKGVDGMSFTIANGQWWRSSPLTDADVRPTINAFQAVGNWGDITNNLLYTGSSVWAPVPASDWFDDDDWTAVLSNTWRAAHLALECGFMGILLDPEQYNCPSTGAWRLPFHYTEYANGGYLLAGESAPRPFEEVAAQVRLRGTQYAETLTGVYPDVVLFVLGLYENTWREVLYDTDGALEEAASSLWPAFVDGLLLGLGGQAALVSATERTYCDSRYAHMLDVRDEALQDSFALSTVPELAATQITFSVGIWTDAGWGADRFSYTYERVNQRRTEWHKHAVHNALAASDEYAWLYGELPWMTAATTTLMEAYWQATQDGRQPQDLAWVPEPWPDLTDYTAHDANMAAGDAAFWDAMQQAGWLVAAELPTSWSFWFDTDNQLRCRDHAGEDVEDSSWPLISTLTCWQSQEFRYNGQAVYRVRFEAPAGLDPANQEIALAFGGYSPGVHNPEPGMLSWMDAAVNEKGYGMAPLIDVTDSIRPGTSNLVAVRVINKTGPAGIMGHVKLLIKPQNTPADVLLDEDFEAYAAGTWLTSVGWTSVYGDVQIADMGWCAGNGIDGETITSAYPNAPTRLYRGFSRPVHAGEHLFYSARVHINYGNHQHYFGLCTGSDLQSGIGLCCDGNDWSLVVYAPMSGTGESVLSAEFWNGYDPTTWWNKSLYAAFHVDPDNDTVRAVLIGNGAVYTSETLSFADGAELELDGTYAWWVGVTAYGAMKMDDILIEAKIPQPLVLGLLGIGALVLALSLLLSGRARAVSLAP